MGLLQRLFRSRAVKDVLYALNSLERSWLAEVPAFGDVLSRARQFVIANPKAIQDQMILEGDPALKIALNLLIVLCARDLTGGHEHIYRGRLSGLGLQKRSVFGALQKMMVERGFATQQDIDAGAARLSKEIAEAG